MQLLFTKKILKCQNMWAVFWYHRRRFSSFCHTNHVDRLDINRPVSSIHHQSHQCLLATNECQAGRNSPCAQRWSVAVAALRFMWWKKRKWVSNRTIEECSECGKPHLFRLSLILQLHCVDARKFCAEPPLAASGIWSMAMVKFIIHPNFWVIGVSSTLDSHIVRTSVPMKWRN